MNNPVNQFRVIASLALVAVMILFAAGRLVGTSGNASKNGVSDDELRSRLTAEQYYVTQESGTERPFKNAYWNNHEAGIYVDVVSGEPLFSSLDKFESGTGWPSFTRPLEADHIVYHSDRKLFIKRTEVRSKQADSHLGHVFDDGPQPTGKRYCMNSAALRFVPAERLDDEGYERYLTLFAQGDSTANKDGAETSGPERETAAFAGGCFWGVEEIIRHIPGVLDTTVGYAGGDLQGPRYSDVSSGTSGHAEAVQVVFDPRRVEYAELLRTFFRLHDPTTLNRQGNDVGSQYRSVIFYRDDAQRKTAERIKAEAAKKWDGDIVTQIVPAGPFSPAEGYHQDYLQKNPGGYTCHYLREG